MRMFVVGLMVSGLTVSAVLGESPKVTKAKKPVPKVVAEPLAQVMAPTGYNIVLGGKPVARFWFRANVPTKASKAAVSYDQLEEGLLLGILQMRVGGALHDFRDQEIPKGLYTLRLARHPDDGDHQGIAETCEFVCLVPVSCDRSLDPVEHEDLLDLAIDGVNTGHPGALYLSPFSKKVPKRFPCIRTNAAKHVILGIQTKATLKDKTEVDFPIGVVIVGMSVAV